MQKRRKGNIQGNMQTDRDLELGFVKPTYARQILTVPTDDRRHIGIIREGRMPGNAFQKDKPAPTLSEDVRAALTTPRTDVIEHPDPKAKRTVDADKAKGKKTRRGSGKAKGRPATHVDKQGERER